MNMESATNEPDPPRPRTHSPGSFAFSSDSNPAKKTEHLGEQEKIKAWALKAAAARITDLDPGAIARAESHMADPNYPDDETLEIVARNLILRKGL